MAEDPLPHPISKATIPQNTLAFFSLVQPLVNSSDGLQYDWNLPENPFGKFLVFSILSYSTGLCLRNRSNSHQHLEERHLLHFLLYDRRNLPLV